MEELKKPRNLFYLAIIVIALITMIVLCVSYNKRSVDTESGETVYLPEVGEQHNGSTYGLADVANGDVYFKVGNDIVKYDNGKKTVVYTADGDDFYGFMFWTDGIIELIYFSSGDRFLVEGEEYKALDGIADFEVKMFDGNTRIFTIDQIYCLQVIYS